MSSTELAVTASNRLSTFLGIPRDTMIDTIKAQCFRGSNNVSDAQLAAFISIANEMQVNPLLPGMLYAYPTQNGIVPMMGPDGVYKRLMEHPAVEAWDTKVFPEDAAVPPTHATTTVYLKGKEHVITYTAYFNEWKVGSNPNWNSRPRHMLGLRSLKQAARQVIHGLPYDEDDKVIGDLVNVTGTGDTGTAPSETKRPDPKQKSTRGVAAALENPKPAETAANPTTPAANAPIDVATSPVAETKAPATVAEKPAEKVADKKAEPAPAKDAASQPVTTLQEGQVVTFEGVTVERFTVKDLTTPEGAMPDSVTAEVKGAFTGKVYHLKGNGPAWQIEKPVTIKLLGKKLKSGAIAPMVQSIELTATDGGATLE